MSDGSAGLHTMRDGGEAPALWAPPWEGVDKMGARFVYVMLIRWADGRGCINATLEEMAARLGIGYSTMRDYCGILQREQLISKPAQGRMADGRMSPLCYWLNLGKLGVAELHRQNSAPDGHAENLSDAGDRRQNSAPVEPGVEDVDKPVDEPPPELSAGALTGAETQHTGAEFQLPALKLSAGENGGVITTGARAGAQARAAFPIPSSSYFLSFAWRDEETRQKAARILNACGPGLGELGAQHNRVLLSLAYVLDVLWVEFDFEHDVLPVVTRKTGAGRKSKLWDFALLTENIETQHGKRMREEAAAAARAEKRRAAGDAKPSAAKGSRMQGGQALPLTDAKRREKIVTLQRLLADFDRGQLEGWRWHLPARDRGLDGEWLDDALRPIVAAKRAELQQLLVEVEDGNGDGAQG